MEENAAEDLNLPRIGLFIRQHGGSVHRTTSGASILKMGSWIAGGRTETKLGVLDFPDRPSPEGVEAA
jgi:hypothetical protein